MGTTSSPSEDCCQKISVKSQGGVLEHYHEALGDYTIESTDESSGKSIYHHQTNLVSIYLHHTVDNDHNWSGWQFTRDDTDVFGFLAIANDDKCPSGKPYVCFFFFIFRIYLMVLVKFSNF